MLQAVALVVSAAFAGAAVYVSAVEHPARMGLEDAPLLQQWKPSYARGAIMQAGLALIGGAFSVASWLATSDLLWLAGAVLMLASWPWTLLVIKPVNDRLKAAERGDGETRALLERWGRLHAVRSGFGVAAVVVGLVAIST
jgi:hypothetical protein